MSGSVVIDVSIGLFGMYLLLSLVCTIINELIASAVGLRASTLKSSLERLVDDPILKVAFDNHGLIDGAKEASAGSDPSYLSGRTFALALLGSVDPTKPLPGFSDIESAVKALPDTNIRDTLLAHIVTAHGDIEQLRDSLATWFDNAMDRVGGIYKRTLKLISLGVAVAVALLVNADTITVVDALWRDGALRTQMAQVSQSLTSDGSKSLGSATANSTAAANKASAVGAERLRAIEQKLRPLPLGWDFTQPQFSNWLEVVLHVLARIIGLAITALALSLGAPFWFDVLQKFINIRGTGAKPQRTQDESA